MPLITLSFIHSSVKEKLDLIGTKFLLTLICSEDTIRSTVFAETEKLLTLYGKSHSNSTSTAYDNDIFRCEFEIQKESGEPASKPLNGLSKAFYESLTIHEQRIIHTLNALFEEHNYTILHPGSFTKDGLCREVTFKQSSCCHKTGSRKRSREVNGNPHDLEPSEPFSGSIADLVRIQKEIPSRKRRAFFNTEEGTKLRLSLHPELRHIPMTFDVKEESWQRKGEHELTSDSAPMPLLSQKKSSSDESSRDAKVTTMRNKRLSCIVCEKKTRHFCSICKAALHVDVVKPNIVSCWQHFHESNKLS
mmetsp:Transcript_18017/g.21894  ORF Transcript_18017/g.21894 Transcript_18017/m.21894 type:complete len:305 (+) Transcript_18017:289-1203(+)